MIKIEGDFFIQEEQYSWNLVRKTGKVSKTGEPVYDILGYYADIDRALNAYVDLKLKDISAQKGIITIKEFLNEYRNLKDSIKRMFGNGG